MRKPGNRNYLSWSSGIVMSAKRPVPVRKRRLRGGGRCRFERVDFGDRKDRG
jgi:hypothetical protein